MPRLPDVTGVARLDFKWSDTVGSFGSRIFVQAGSAGWNTADAVEAATQVEALYASVMPITICETYALTEVTATDLSSDTGATGSWFGSEPGSITGGYLPANVTADMSIHIADRYRGGHPLTHWPPPGPASLMNARELSAAALAVSNPAYEDFFTGLNEITVDTFPPFRWVVLRGYRPGVLPEAVTQSPVVSVSARQYVGTMRRRARSLR